MAITIPNRFESLQEAFPTGTRPLIIPIDDDIRRLIGLREHADIQNGGLLCFLLGRTGIGKTTLAHSASVSSPELFTPVYSVPPEIPLREAIKWISTNVPRPNSEKAQLVLFDGREVSDDQVGLKQFLSALNQILRARPRTLLLWPTTDLDWHRVVRQQAETIGGENLSPHEADIHVSGPSKTDWPKILDRLLLQFGKNIADVGIDASTVDAKVALESTIGDFLLSVGKDIASRVSKTRQLKHLPQIVFVVSSSGDVVGEANRIRRAGTQNLAAEPLLGHSTKSEVGRWWTERNQNPLHHLGYIISLFEAKLVTVTAPAVVYSCLHHGESDLKEAATAAGARADRGNAGRTIKASELYRLLQGEAVPEFTSSRKGALQDSTKEAYASIQSRSTKRHKAINKAVCSLLAEHTTGLSVDDSRYECASCDNTVITDAIIGLGNDDSVHLEFHHLSEQNCRAPSMASYIMDKLRNYAMGHNIIPR